MALRQRILVIDDNETNVVLLERVLRSGGYHDIHRCLDSREALATVDAARPDVILLDLHMPHLDGRAVLEGIQATTPGTEFLPVLVLTADATGHSRDLMLGAGAHDFLTKPFDANEVLLRVRNLLRTRSLQHTVTELLDQTLTGAVEALLEVLSLANPVAFSRASRIAALVNDLVQAVKPPDAWSIKFAAAISQIGAVTLGPEVAEKLDSARPLTRAEQGQVDRLPLIAAGIVKHLPQLEDVTEILASQQRVGSDRGIGGSILRIAIDIDQLEARGLSRIEAIAIMRNRSGEHNREVLAVAEQLALQVKHEFAKVETGLNGLLIGMTIAEDLRDRDGTLLISHGQIVTERMFELLRNRGERLPDTFVVYADT